MNILLRFCNRIGLDFIKLVDKNYVNNKLKKRRGKCKKCGKCCRYCKYLDKKTSKSWWQDQGSEGEFHVNRNTIDLELNLKDEEFRSSGFHKEIKL